MSGSFCLFGSALAEPFGQAGKVFFLVYEELECVVLVQDVVAERNAECGKLLVDFTQACLLVGGKVGSRAYKVFVYFIPEPLLFRSQSQRIFLLLIHGVYLLKQLFIERDIVSVFGQYRSEFHGEVSQFVGRFGFRQIVEYTAYTVQHGRTVVEGKDYILEVGSFGVINDSLDIGILFLYTFQEGRLVMLQFDLVERGHAVRGLELGKERIAFRLGGTGVHHTTCC